MSQASNAPVARAVDWSQPIQTRDGRPGIVLGQEGWQRVSGDTRRRVTACNYNPPGPKHEHESYTTWLCDERGRVRGDGAESPHDIINGPGNFTWAPKL